MHILLSTDNNYVMPTGVLMHSIGINNREDLTFHVMVNESFSDVNKDILNTIACQYGKRISFYVITEEMTSLFPFGRENMPTHISIATYYRLLVTKILPRNVHRIIYLDGDMIVRHSLQDLWKTDISDYAIGVVHDQDEKIMIASQRLPYPMETGYFNAGMLLINIDYWREHGCFEWFMTFIRDHGECIKMHDQDVLNAVFYDKKKWIPLTYNFQSGFLQPAYNPPAHLDTLFEEIEETKNDPVIIHYCAFIKPWEIWSINLYTRVWRFYLSKTLWKNFKLKGDEPKGVKECLMYFLYRHNILLPSSKYRFNINLCS